MPDLHDCTRLRGVPVRSPSALSTDAPRVDVASGPEDATILQLP
jgi:hypothetical protein